LALGEIRPPALPVFLALSGLVETMIFCGSGLSHERAFLGIASGHYIRIKGGGIASLKEEAMPSRY
jgi:hypothetical protein